MILTTLCDINAVTFWDIGFLTDNLNYCFFSLFNAFFLLFDWNIVHESRISLAVAAFTSDKFVIFFQKRLIFSFSRTIISWIWLNVRMKLAVLSV